MRATLLSFLLVLAVVAAVHLVPALCISRYEKLESKGEEAGGTAAEEHGGSIKPLSLDGYGPLDKAAKNTKEQILNAQATPAKTANTYDQKPSKEQAETATASIADELPDKYVQEEAPAEVKKEKSDESDESSTVPKKVKKEKEKSDESVKKEKSDDLDESAIPKKVKKEKKEKPDDSDENEKKESEHLYRSTSPKKEKKEKSDYLDESTSSKKEKKEKSENSDASSSSKKKKKKVESDASDEDASLNKKEKKKAKKEENKSGDSDESMSHKKQNKEKKEKKKKEKSDEENPEEDAAPVDVSTDGAYVSSSSSTKEEKSDEDASTPVDVSTTTTDQYLASLKNDGKPKGGERQISTPTADAYASPDEPPPAAKSSATPDAPDELPPAAKSSAVPDVYATSKQQVLKSQPTAAGSPDELPPAAKSASATPDPFASMKFAAGGAGGPPIEPAPGTPLPKLSMEIIKRPMVKTLSPMIKSVCAQTQYPADCEASIGGLPGAASAAAMDSVAVLKLAMEAVRQKVVEALNVATARMNAPGTDEKTKEALSSCATSYTDMKTSLDSVDDALNRGDVDTAHTNLDSVETDVGDCDEGFQDFGSPPIMTDHDKELNKLASNLVAIGAALRH